MDFSKQHARARAFYINNQKARSEHCAGCNGILFPKLLWPTVRKNCFSDQEKPFEIKELVVLSTYFLCTCQVV